MRNKLLPLTTLVLSTTPFAFRKMEGPFFYGVQFGTPLGQNPNKNQEPVKPITEKLIDLCAHWGDHQYQTVHQEEYEKEFPKGDQYMFNYEPNTGYVLMLSYQNPSAPLSERINILKGNVDDINEKYPNLDFFCFKKPLEKTSNGFYLADSVYKMCFDTYDGWNPDKTKRPSSWYNLRLTKSFTTSSGITVSNENYKVTLNKDDKSKELKDALKQYFRYENSIDVVINAVVNRDQILNKEVDRSKSPEQSREPFEIGEAAADIRNKSSILDLVAKSEIKTVYGVIEDESNDGSILFGMAESNVGEKEKFFWITKIKGDLSALLK